MYVQTLSETRIPFPTPTLIAIGFGLPFSSDRTQRNTVAAAGRAPLALWGSLLGHSRAATERNIGSLMGAELIPPAALKALLLRL